jgi:hypothetical protein
MVVATLHLGRSGYGRWGGGVISVIWYLSSLLVVLFLALPDMVCRPVIMSRKRCSTTAELHWPQLA